jgi:YD repeat-containing protein
MASETPFSLELTVYFNNKVLGAMTLQIPAENSLMPNPNGTESCPAKGGARKAIPIVLNISGDSTSLEKLRERPRVMRANLHLPNWHLGDNYEPGQKATFSYDGRLSSITDANPLAFRTTFTYDADGNRQDASDSQPEDTDSPDIVE